MEVGGGGAEEGCGQPSKILRGPSDDIAGRLGRSYYSLGGVVGA